MIALRFTRGASLYQIAPAYAGGEGYVGLRDGRVVARAMDRAAVALALITPATSKSHAPDTARQERQRRVLRKERTWTNA